MCSRDVLLPHLVHDLMHEIAVTDKLHRSDEPNLGNAKIVRGYARRFRPGSWVFVGPEVEKALGIRQVRDGTSERKLRPHGATNQ